MKVKAQQNQTLLVGRRSLHDVSGLRRSWAAMTIPGGSQPSLTQLSPSRFRPALAHNYCLATISQVSSHWFQLQMAKAQSDIQGFDLIN